MRPFIFRVVSSCFQFLLVTLRDMCMRGGQLLDLDPIQSYHSMLIVDWMPTYDTDIR